MLPLIGHTHHNLENDLVECIGYFTPALLGHIPHNLEKDLVECILYFYS